MLMNYANLKLFNLDGKCLLDVVIDDLVRAGYAHKTETVDRYRGVHISEIDFQAKSAQYYTACDLHPRTIDAIRRFSAVMI